MFRYRVVWTLRLCVIILRVGINAPRHIKQMMISEFVKETNQNLYEYVKCGFRTRTH